MSGPGQSRNSVVRAGFGRRLAWVVVPAVALLQFALPILAPVVSPAKADTIVANSATAGPAKISVVVENRDSTLDFSALTSLNITNFRWLISAEHTAGAYGLDGTVHAGTAADPKTPGYDATGDPDKASQTGACLPFTTPVVNNTPVTNPGYSPSACQWPSVRYTPGAVPVVAQGDQADLSATGEFLVHGTTTPITFRPGRYLVSVTSDGYKIDGAHFDVDATKGEPTAQVRMHAYPVPLGTLRLRVFKDSAPVDGTYEVGAEDGLPGFTTHINDVFGEVTTDFWGNRLCTKYQKDGAGKVLLDAGGFPLINTTDPGGTCTSVANGDVVIPNLGPNRYTASVVPPANQKWYQTTTLEGNHDWDMWISENETGYDTEQTVGGEPVPPVDMGFVPYNTAGTTALDAGPAALTGTKTITGSAVIINSYVGGTGGVTIPNAGVAGANVRGPLSEPIITLSDLDNGDQLVYVGRGGTDGRFTIPNVPPSNYQLTVWDYPQDYILDSFNVTVNAGDTTIDVGQKGLVGWYANLRGKICIDDNANGKCDPGETGVPKFFVGVKYRDNSVLDAGQNGTTTDDQGNYTIAEGYPISKWFILEAFNTGYKTTGITVQADNQPTEETFLGAGVDVNVLPIIGLSGRVDWAVQRYSATENGGIVGTVTYDTTRNELDPKYAATEGYQPGIPGLTVHLYAPVDCSDANTGLPLTTPSAGVAGVPDGSLCGQDDGYWHKAQPDPSYTGTGTAPTVPGALQPYSDSTGTPVDLEGTYTTETWDQSTGCAALQHDGTPVSQWAIPQGNQAQAAAANKLCVEAPMLGIQARPSEFDKTAGSFAQTVNGNYGFGTVNRCPADPTKAADCTTTFDPNNATPAEAAIPNGDYIVTVDIPTVGGQDLYKPTQEEDVNIADGDIRAPQENFPQPANPSGAAGDQSPGSGGPVSQGNGFIASCVGDLHKVNVTDGGFLSIGGSPYQGQARSLCGSKLVNLRGGQSVAPNFNLFTPVPLPTHFWGLTINDLGLSQDKTQAGYGEAQPLPNVPMGIYDWSGRLVDTVNTDVNGMYEALEPSTSSYNCPLPAGPCPGIYYFKGNDPGQPGHVNANYNPRFRTIGTEFQAWPGLWTVTDTAPTQVGVVAVAPGSAQINPVDCSVNAGINTSTGTDVNAKPDIMTVSTPYLTSSVSTTGGTPAVTQNLPITRVAISGAGTTASPKTVTLTTSATVTPATIAGYDYLQLPNLIAGGTNNSFPYPPATSAANLAIRLTTVAQLAAINATNQAGLTAAAGTSRHRIASITPGAGSTTITFALTGLPALAPNTPVAGYAATVTAQSVTLAIPGATVPSSQQVTISGDGFGATPGRVTLTKLDGAASNLVVSGVSWANRAITFTAGSSTTAAPTPGVYQLSVTGSNGIEAVNGLTFHVLGGTGATGYNPTVIQVPARPTTAPAVTGEINANTLAGAVTDGDPNTTPENVLQLAVNRAATVAGGQALVVVWPKTPIANNPKGEYYENLVVHSNVKIQGVGPGGIPTGGTAVLGSQLDGLGFNPDNNAGTAWVNTVAGIPHNGPVAVPDAAVVTYLGQPNNFNGAFTGALDGVTVTGGSQADFATADIGAEITNGVVGTPFGAPGALITQGGGIYLHSAANNVRISNNVIVGNSGSYAGAIRVGSPYASTPPQAAPANTGVTITRNRIRDNGGTNLAGGVGIFAGSTGYTVSSNDLCGNFSAEYGGAISHYGRSDGGAIAKNRIYLNESYDEGGGVIIAGELPANPNNPSTGAGTGLTVNANTIQDNIANDDGGGLRFLQATTITGTGASKTAAEIDVTNNLIVDNISSHEGGGVALDDAVNVHLTGNTIMKNLTTATAITSNGQPAPAGISTATNSDPLQAALSGTGTFSTTTYSQPRDFRDNIIWGNLAGTWDPASGTVLGITPGGTGANAPRVWEVGSVDSISPSIPISWSLVTSVDPQLAATNLQTQAYPATGIPTFVKNPYDVGVQIITSRAFPSFREAVIVVSPVAPRVTEDYHLKAGTAAAPANSTGGTRGTAGFSTGIAALMANDIDTQPRPNTNVDIGADEN